ncbi:hypothetical protein [Pontibacter ummariensis]|uniref:hypothetical protein n=1 Tax=Pontibacter ummariensis TaxID=1610492 RepID=UPI0011861816|nr:hypothetical protein [Pontibacter ummariensis]
MQTIDNTFIGRIIDDKVNVLKSINPDRFYVENVRRFYNLPSSVAKVFCEMAVREGYFKKRFAVKCPNQECGRIIVSVDSPADVPDYIECDICEALERDEYCFSYDEVEIEPYYQISRERASSRKEASYVR